MTELEFKTDKWHEARQAKTLEKYKNTLNEYGFEYVSGYLNNKVPMVCKCMKCGTERTVTGDYLGRKPKAGRTTGMTCKECERREKEERHLQEKEQKQEEHKRRMLIMRFKSRVRAVAKQKEYIANTLTKTCRYCGKEYETHSKASAFCSAICCKKWSNRETWRLRRCREKNATIDTNISLKRLYERDEGRCYICGQTCDWNDYIVRDGTVIAGNNYPSIDHVKPLSKGGEHSWKNIRLACRHCNTLKGNISPQSRGVYGGLHDRFAQLN